MRPCSARRWISARPRPMTRTARPATRPTRGRSVMPGSTWTRFRRRRLAPRSSPGRRGWRWPWRPRWTIGRLSAAAQARARQCLEAAGRHGPHGRPRRSPGPAAAALVGTRPQGPTRALAQAGQRGRPAQLAAAEPHASGQRPGRCGRTRGRSEPARAPRPSSPATCGSTTTWGDSSSSSIRRKRTRRSGSTASPGRCGPTRRMGSRMRWQAVAVAMRRWSCSAT